VKAFRDLPHAGPARLAQRLRYAAFQLGWDLRPPKAFALTPGPRKPGADSFLDHAAFDSFPAASFV